MRHHQWTVDIRHASSQPKPITTLGWTQFAIVAGVIAAVLLLTGVVILPW